MRRFASIPAFALAIGLTVSVFGSDVTLQWDPPTHNTDGTPLTDLAGYKLGYGRTSGSSDQTLDVGAATTRTLTGLQDGATYYAVARAYNAAGRESTNCAEISFIAPDRIAPAITAPTPRTLNAGSDGKAAIPNFLTSLVVTDNVTAAAQIIKSQSPTSGVRVALGDTTVTLTARDEAGNTATASVLVTVVDRTAPAITQPADVSVYAGAGNQAAVPDFLSALVVSDNCTPAAGIVKTQAPAAGTNVGLGDTSVLITATDGAGNASSVTVRVTVRALPVPAAPSNLRVVAIVP